MAEEKQLISMFDCDAATVADLVESLAPGVGLQNMRVNKPRFVSLALSLSVAAGNQRYMIGPGTNGAFDVVAVVPGVNIPQNFLLGTLTCSMKPTYGSPVAYGNCAIQQFGVVGSAMELFSTQFGATALNGVPFNVPLIGFSAILWGNDAASAAPIICSAKFDGWIASLR